MKDELIQQLRMLGMGRVNAAQAIADILMPDQPAVAKVTESTTQELIEHFDEPATVEIEVEPEAPAPQTWPGKDKDEYDAFFKPPVKPKRKKGLVR